MSAHGLELAYAVRVVEPREAVRGDAPIRRDRDAVEICAIGPRPHDVAVALHGYARRLERAAMCLDARRHVGLAHGAELETVRNERWREIVELTREMEKERLVVGAPLESSALQRRDGVLIDIEGVGLGRPGPLEHAVEQLGPVGMDAEIEHAAFEQPAVRSHPALFLPEARLPERLAARVLKALPR